MKKFTKVWNSVWDWIECNLLLIALVVGTFLAMIYTGDGNPFLLAIFIALIVIGSAKEES